MNTAGKKAAVTGEALPPDSERKPAGRHARRDVPRRSGGRKKKPDRITVILVALMVIGAGIMVYPAFSNWWNEMHASRAIAAYSHDVSETDETELEAMFSAALEYNRKFAEKDNQFFMSAEETAQYNSLLDPSGTGLMAYVTIPSLNETIPIYHGTDEAVLQTAVGHLEWTSLPVGGESSHAVISGHRGLPRAKLFSDLDRLKIGDMFTVTVLNRMLTYQVDQILVVLPSETDALTVFPGEDFCTLVTCTPYGINTHRLLVRGSRIENLLPRPDGGETEPDEARVLPRILTVTAVVIPALFLFLSVVYLRLLVKRRALRAAAMRPVERGKHE